MPNNIRTELYITAQTRKEKQEVLKFIKSSKKQLIDFRKIVPRPATLMIEHSSDFRLGLTYLDSIKTNTEKDALRTLFGLSHMNTSARRAIRLGQIAKYNLEKYGYDTWYDWNWDNWGTKWNAYDCELVDSIDGDILRFETAWSPCLPIIRALAERFTHVDFYMIYADEDMGYNCGYIEYVHGKLSQKSDFTDGSDEALKFACDVWGADYNDYKTELES